MNRYENRKHLPLRNLKEIIDIHMKYSDNWYLMSRCVHFLRVAAKSNENSFTDITYKDVKRLEELGWGGVPIDGRDNSNSIIDKLTEDLEIIKDDIEELKNGRWILRCLS